MILIKHHSPVFDNPLTAFGNDTGTGTNQPYQGAAMSDDGQKILLTRYDASANLNPAYSSNGGTSWASVTSLASSKQGRCAMSGNGQIWYILHGSTLWFSISSDLGSSWAHHQFTGFTSIDDVAVSKDGVKILVADTTGKHIAWSVNTGGNWATSSVLSGNVVAVAVSGDGTHWYRHINGVGVQKSTDDCVNWGTATGPSGTSTLRSMCCSFRGQYVYVTDDTTGHIFRSCDYGATWVDIGQSSSGTNLACSADGRVVYFDNSQSGGANTKISFDCGATFNTCTGGNNSVSYQIACSASGKKSVIVYGSATYVKINSDNYTVLLLHANGTGASLVDSSPSPKAVTAYGNATQSATQSKFGGKSLYLDGTSGTYVSVDNSTDFDFGSGNFTIDWWEYRTVGTGAAATLARSGTGTYPSFLMGYYYSGTLYFFASSTGSSWNVIDTLSMGAAALNTWTHLAVVRSGTTFYTFKNGTLQASRTGSGSLFVPSAPLHIGRYNTTNYFPGYIDELRISKGVARWTSNFTPPTSEY